MSFFTSTFTPLTRRTFWFFIPLLVSTSPLKSLPTPLEIHSSTPHRNEVLRLQKELQGYRLGSNPGPASPGVSPHTMNATPHVSHKGEGGERLKNESLSLCLIFLTDVIFPLVLFSLSKEGRWRAVNQVKNNQTTNTSKMETNNG